MKFTCCGCKKELDASVFYLRHKEKAPVRRSDWMSRCVSCEKEYKRNYYLAHATEQNANNKKRRYDNHDLYLQTEAARRLARSSDPNAVLRRRTVSALDPTARYIHVRTLQWKRSAKKRNLEWSLTNNDLLALFHKQQGLCYYLSEPLLLGPNSHNTLSLDRLDSTRGYTIDNVVMCGATVNRMKLDLSVDDFKQVIAALHTNSSRW